MALTLLGPSLKRLMAPSPKEVSFEVRGFDTTDAPARTQLEMSALQFLIGFEFAIEQKGHEALVTRLETLEEQFRGFAYEGAVMALTMRDTLSPAPGNKLVETFLAGPRYDSALGSKHVFMAYIGLGFALANLPKPLWRRALPDQSKLVDHPTLNWLAMDGYGFHQAFFEKKKWVDAQYVGKRYPWPGPADYTNRAIDQGIGRAMWFVHGGNVEKLLADLDRFPPARRSDLYCGAGLAATYAGGVDAEALELYFKGAGEYRPDVAQGAVFALRARVVSGLVTPNNEIASQVFCGITAEQASDIAAQEIVDLPPDGAVPAYEVFRQRVQNHFR
jgi:enediyne biosynthesis protein E2